MSEELVRKMVGSLGYREMPIEKPTEIEERLNAIGILTQPIAEEMAMGIIENEVIRLMKHHKGQFRLSDISKCITRFNKNEAEQLAKDMIIRHGGKRLELIKIIEKAKNNWWLIQEAAKEAGINTLYLVAVFGDQYELTIREIAWECQLYELKHNQERKQNWANSKRLHLNKVKVLLHKIRVCEDAIASRIGPFAWLARETIFQYPNPAKVFIYYERNVKKTVSYERDWLPI